MRSLFFIIPAAFVFNTARAQDPMPATISQPASKTTPVGSSTTLTPVSTGSASSTTSTEYTQISIMDYKSVYEAATLEEEVQMATERFNLSKSQQEVWATAAVDRREKEKQTRVALESKNNDYSKNDIYKGLRSAQTEFYETITGFFDPTQKRALERDRLILEEKRKMIAKLPPPVIAPTVTVAPIDSTAIKAEMLKEKKAKQKARKKKKTVGT
jgi:hypothetical protein